VRRDAEFTRQKEKLQKIGRADCQGQITAPTDGVVIYATSTQFSFRGNVEPLAEGQQVIERQDSSICRGPTPSTAVVKIHESSLKKI